VMGERNLPNTAKRSSFINGNVNLLGRGTSEKRGIGGGGGDVLVRGVSIESKGGGGQCQEEGSCEGERIGGRMAF